MCLTTIDEKPVECEYGYKVFKVFGDKLYSAYSQKLSKSLPINKWIDEKDWRENKRLKQLRADKYPQKKYPLGWHIFVKLSSARHFYKNCLYDLGKTIRKVKIKGIAVSGIQDWSKDLKVVVAKKMLIMPK